MFHVKIGDTCQLEDDAADSAVSLVPTRGALVTRFRVQRREILYLDESTLGDATKNVRGGIPILFPSPGKLADDAFSYAGRSGAMKQHGFARDLPWQVTATSTANAASMTLSLDADDATRAKFPWDFRLAVTFTLVGTRLRLGVRVENKGAEPMPFAFGTHPYFAVTDKEHTTIPTRATLAFDNVTKQVVPFRGFDLAAKEIDLHLLDHGSTESSLTQKDGSRIVVRGSPEFTRWVVWAVRGKDYVCLEPWTAPANALNTQDGLIVLAAGAARDLWIELEA